jgi:hypothetical protein
MSAKLAQDLDCVCYSSTINETPSELIVGFTMVRASPSCVNWQILLTKPKFVEEFVEVLCPGFEGLGFKP